MKKTMIQGLTAAAAFAMLAAQPMTAMAATLGYTSAGNGQYKIITGGKQNADIKELLGNLNADCDIPGVIISGGSIQGGNFPGINIPGINIPGSNVPDNSLPTPEFPTPDVPETPDQPNLPDDGNQGGTSQDAWLSQIVDLVNAERAKAGVAALSVHNGAAKAAKVRAEETSRSFSHTRPNGKDFSTALKEAGVSYSSAGENIAYGQRSPQAVMDQWMNSAGHRANILNPNFTAIGVGHYESSNGTNYWTQLFIR